MDESFSTAEELVFVHDNNFLPLEFSRVNELAIQYWNLKKSYDEKNSVIVEQKKKFLSSKHLIHNLQKTIDSLKHDLNNRSQEIANLKTAISELESLKEHFDKDINSVRFALYRQKRLMGFYKEKVKSLEESIEKVEKERDVQLSKWSMEFDQRESTYSCRLEELKVECNGLKQEKIKIATELETVSLLTKQLEEKVTQIEKKNILDLERYESHLKLISEDHEKAFDSLQIKYEIVSEERDELKARLEDEENKNHLLNSWILTQGLQLPSTL